jgi:hypothetical protein
MELDEPSRWRAVTAVLEEVEHSDRNLASEIRAQMGGPGTAPTATVPADVWNAERLDGFLAEIDAAIGTGQYERAVTLSYTCLEGFYGAFLQPSHRAGSPTRLSDCRDGLGLPAVSSE